MNRMFHGFSILVTVTVLIAGCATQKPAEPAEPPDTRAQDEAAIRATSKAWGEAAAAKDPDKFTSFYADDAVVILEDAPDVTGKTAIRETLGGMMMDPAFNLSFETTGIEVARSGDLAYELGKYTITMTDPKTKKPVNETGQGITIWKKQADGSWKARVDAPISDPPGAAAAQK